MRGLTVANVVVMSLTGRAGQHFTTEQVARRVIECFGGARKVEKVTNGQAVQLRVTCGSQRGEDGSFRLHAHACAAGIPVYVE